MHSRRAFLKTVGSGAAVAFVRRDARAQSAEERFAASGLLGRIALIEARVTCLPGQVGQTPWSAGVPRVALAATCLGCSAAEGLAFIPKRFFRHVERPLRTRRPGGLPHSPWLPMRVSAGNAPDAVLVSYNYGDMLINLDVRSAAKAGIRTTYYGTEGTLIVTDGRWEVHWNNGRTEAGKCA